MVLAGWAWAYRQYSGPGAVPTASNIQQRRHINFIGPALVGPFAFCCAFRKLAPLERNHRHNPRVMRVCHSVRVREGDRQGEARSEPDRGDLKYFTAKRPLPSVEPRHGVCLTERG